MLTEEQQALKDAIVGELLGLLDNFPPAPPHVDHPKMPPEIAKAIVAVCKGIKATLTKDEMVKAEGKERAFRYVSVDQFYELAGPLMADAGLFLVAYEAKLEVEQRDKYWDGRVVGKTSWLACEFDLVLYHESGVEFGPVRRTITVIASGPQAYASAQSYLEKYFLRNLFKIATYDPETVEEHDKSELPPKETGRGAADSRQSSRAATGKPASFSSLDARERLIREVEATTTEAEFWDWNDKVKDDPGYQKLFKEDADALAAACKKHHKGLKDAAKEPPADVAPSKDDEAGF